MEYREVTRIAENDAVFSIFEAESLAQKFRYSYLFERKLLVVGLLDILYPTTFDSLSLESGALFENRKMI